MARRRVVWVRGVVARLDLHQELLLRRRERGLVHLAVREIVLRRAADLAARLRARRVLGDARLPDRLDPFVAGGVARGDHAARNLETFGLPHSRDLALDHP